MLHEYQTHNELNPQLWTSDQTMSDNVRYGFLKIANAFYEFLEIDTHIIDIVLIGSNANYNWTDNSDIDIHVVVNYLEIGSNLFLVENYLRAKKSIWSSKYPLKYKGMDIELYAQDSNQDLHGSVGIFSFGILGNFRMGGNVFEASISDDWRDFFNIFSDSLIWFYVYATGGINNLYFNINNVDPNYLPIYSFAKLIPSIVYDALGLPKIYDSFDLVDGRLTVSTAYQGVVSDFGVYGILVYLPIIIICQFVHRKAVNGSDVSILYYGILMQTVILTPYIDTVFYLTFTLQLAMVAFSAVSANKFLYRFVRS